jgi:hypothetical protein
MFQRSLSLERWRFCLAWLSAGFTGVLPEPLWQTLGVVKTVQREVRWVAEMLHPWMLLMLAERQRRGLTVPDRLEPQAAAALMQALLARRFTSLEIERSPSRLLWHIEQELVLLPQLAEAPSSCLYRQGWLECEVCYWALTMRCLRIGQLYHALAAQVEPAEARRGLEVALARAAHQLLRAAQAA